VDDNKQTIILLQREGEKRHRERERVGGRAKDRESIN